MSVPTLSLEPPDAGALTVDQTTLEVWYGRRRLPLTPMEARLLAVMMERPGDVVLTQSLARELWPGHALQPDEADRRLYVHVARLRGKLPSAWAYKIARMRKRGYVLLTNQPG
ncbi:MAG: winged helix-turn-helix domain-containing protein [Dehalococcoidia bacterium]